MKISTKLTIGYLLASILVAVIGLVGLHGILSISGCFDEIVDSTSKEIPTLERLSAQFFKMRLECTACVAIIEHEHDKSSKKVVLSDDSKALEQMESTEHPLSFQEKCTQFNQANAEAKELIALYLSYTPGFNEPIADSLETVRLLHEGIFNQILAADLNHSLDNGNAILVLLEAAAEAHNDKINDAIKDETDFSAREEAEAHHTVLRSKWLIGLLSLIAISLAILLGLYLSRSISKPLTELTKATELLSKGNYRSKVNIQQGDEIGILATSFNKMVDELGHAKILEQQKAQLEHLNQELERKNEALDNFVYRVSHDLKAPIVNISSLINLLKKKWPAPDQRLEQTISFIADSTVKLQQTVFDLLELSRLERKIDKELELIDLESVMFGVQESLRENINQSKAVIEADFSKAPVIQFTRIDIVSILTNLLSNAIKYARAGVPPRIQISTHAAHPFVCLTINDNGMGIDLARHQNKLFGMFMRFHDHVEGSGVGLYIIKKLVTDSGGRVEIDSTVGRGTTFRIFLPILSKEMDLK